MNSESEHLITLLHTGCVEDRYRAAQMLSRHQPTQKVLLALVEALADEEYYETPGDYDAPTWIWCVADAAYETLREFPRPDLQALQSTMHDSAYAAKLVAKLLPAYGEPGRRLLADLAQHSDQGVREEAVRQLSPSENRDAVLWSLADPSGAVTSTAIAALRRDGVPNPPDGLIAALQERLRAHPQAGTFAEALELFAPRSEVLETLVDMAVQGSECCSRLLIKHAKLLSPEQLAALTDAPPSVSLIRLWEALGDRAVPTLPRLLGLCDDPAYRESALRAMLHIPGGLSHHKAHLAEYYIQYESLRSSMVKLGVCPAGLSQRLVDGWERSGDLSFLRGLQTLGPGAKDALPWLKRQLGCYGPDIPRSYALSTLATFGEEAVEAFPEMLDLLDKGRTRVPVLKALVVLGPVAHEYFSPWLELLKEESPRWSLFDRNNQLSLLDEAIEALHRSARPSTSQAG